MGKHKLSLLMRFNIKYIMKDKGINKALGRYVAILEGKEKARYLSADLDSKVKKVEKIIENCVFCERRCEKNRKKGKSLKK